LRSGRVRAAGASQRAGPLRVEEDRVLNREDTPGRPNVLGRPIMVSQVTCPGATYFNPASASCTLVTDSE
jgi:hypothetical protein